jgi:chromatin structure-remodeling complex subunit RSC1/2
MRCAFGSPHIRQRGRVGDTCLGVTLLTFWNRDYYPSVLFRRIPNKRNLPEYHTIIQEPRAISTLRQKAQTRKYTNFAEYVRDFALIVHNAHVFNRPNSGPVRDVLVLKALFEEELARLVERGLIAKEDTIFPDLGEIPEDATPEPELKTDDEEEGEEDVEGDDDDEDDDDDQDDSDEEGKGKRRRRVGRPSMAGRKRNRSAEGQKGGEVDARKRRGRPPRVDTPMEARIKAVLKSIRKFRSEAGHLKVLPFERLPDKTQNPGYYIEIKEPMAVDLIKRKVKRKKYQSLEHFMKDMELMFHNAMQYNEDESDLYKDAKELWEEAKSTAEAEKQKPDTEYLMEDGKLPLPNGILHNNELWKVGDWVHIQNPNDVTKPIVAQIYRTWQNTDGQQWVNACWYYRPEQTVHHYEKHFYPNEVVKTGQYRDHHIDEIIDRCFVMFFTRYNRGRPRGLDPTKEVYVCEARYNAEKHRLNKIKTWASCLPDEVREKDYEMDLFEAAKKIKKLPSPIKHLLKPGANETDELPSPQWGRENAPPIVGAVHAQPRDENVCKAERSCHHLVFLHSAFTDHSLSNHHHQNQLLRHHQHHLRLHLYLDRYLTRFSQNHLGQALTAKVTLCRRVFPAASHQQFIQTHQ